MTATVNKSDREDIKKSLGPKNCYEIVGNPDRRNFMYEKHFRAGADIDSLMDILSPIAQGLLEDAEHKYMNISPPPTELMCPL